MNNSSEIYRKYYSRSIWKALGYISLFWLSAISKIIPRVQGRVLFGSMNGYAIADNSKYLYDNFSEPNVDKYFITKNKDALKCRLKDGKEPVYAYSVKGVYLQLTAERVFYTHGIFDFFPPLIWGAEKHNLWHGVPIKEIGPGADWKQSSRFSRYLKEKFYKKIGYFYYMSCDFVYCSVPEKVVDYQRYFSISKPQVIIKKQPRNEFGFTRVTSSRKILYSPTYRAPGSAYDIGSLLVAAGIYSEELNRRLNEHEEVLFIRPHPIDRSMAQSITLPSNVYWDFSLDLYESLSTYSLVITDYSSIFYDCIERGIPCKFYAPDLYDYNDRVGLDPKLFNLIERERLAAIYLF